MSLEFDSARIDRSQSVLACGAGPTRTSQDTPRLPSRQQSPVRPESSPLPSPISNPATDQSPILPARHFHEPSPSRPLPPQASASLPHTRTQTKQATNSRPETSTHLYSVVSLNWQVEVRTPTPIVISQPHRTVSADFRNRLDHSQIATSPRSPRTSLSNSPMLCSVVTHCNRSLSPHPSPRNYCTN